MARELKYSSHHTDFDALQRELSSGGPEDGHTSDRLEDSSEDEYDDYRR
ncbi:hypothetical protein UO65_3410 [Actinokineospora spheciospongiae]|uniref:DUF3073 domain-containing protein n=1 Tax=Actinokineospora spheciospongiae TaxID=909613 RepID=W7IKB4_9PSEU|nr:hypothetical protein UO65_3410 [Actinokineospora spheciospongiae]